MSCQDDSTRVQYIKASVLRKSDSQSYEGLINKIEEKLNFICQDYPDHRKWFKDKVVVGISNGTREIIACNINDNLAGVTILKHTSEEAKICTLYVSEHYRGKGIASSLLERSFKYLGTTKPVITMSSDKVAQFNDFINRYEWKETRRVKDMYRKDSIEVIFNSK